MNDFAGLRLDEQQIQIEFREKHRVAQIVFLGERRQQLAEFAQRQFAAERHGGGFQKQRRAFRALAERHAAQAELLQKFLDEAFQIVGVKLRVAFVAAPEIQRALAGDGDGDVAVFLRLAVRVREHAADFKQRHVVIFPADIVPQRMNQTRQQARPQHVHVAAQRIGQRDQFFILHSAF